MFCPHCGAQVADDAPYCPACGRPQNASAGAPPAPAYSGIPQGVKAQTGKWIGDGWDIIKSDILTFALMTLITLLICSVVPIILQGALFAGLQLACARKLIHGRMEFGDLFLGFNFFVPTMVASILISVFAAIGFLVCIVPGLVICAMYSFTYLFIVDKRMEFWPAMQASFAIVKQDYVGFTLFFVVGALINILGTLACLIGVLVTVPTLFASQVAAYKELVGFEPNTVKP